MAERDLIEKLNQAVDAIIGKSAEVPEPETLLGELIAMAGSLRELPDPHFRARLSAGLTARAHAMNNDIEQEKTMTPTINYIREGFHTVTPYLHVQGADRFIEFLKQAFGAEAGLRVPRPDGSVMHAEVKIGDSILEMADESSVPNAFHVYVQDADTVYQHALDAGATSLHPMTDQPYGDREGSVKDPFGNFWYIATHKLAGPSQHRPKGLYTVTPYLHPKGADRLIEFMERGFNAQAAEVHRSPDGNVMHAKIQLGDSIIEMSEAHGQWQPLPAVLHMYVPDTDVVYNQAIAAGATSLSAPEDKPYGERNAGVKDPAGNIWYIATHIRDVEF